jgi:KDO2-lipid IV(A) lauroyltransferase
LECGGKRSATPLWIGSTALTSQDRAIQSAAAVSALQIFAHHQSCATLTSQSLPLMSKSNLQINLEYLVASLLLVMFGWLPLRVALFVGSKLGRSAYYFSGRLRRTGLRNLELAFPELDQSRRLLLLRGCFESLGRLLGVFSHFATADPRTLQSMIECEGLEHIDAARESGRGIILFTGHVGAWELSSFALSLFGHPLSFLVRRIDNPKIETMVARRRERLGNRTIDKRSAAREMLQILQGNGTLGILVDLNTLDREGIFVDFFDVPASTTFMLAKLALRTEAAVLPVFAPWDRDRQRFLLKIDEPLRFERSGDDEDDVRRLTQLFTDVVEKYVRRYPDQWLWIHRRWKTRPPGEPEIYD